MRRRRRRPGGSYRKPARWHRLITDNVRALRRAGVEVSGVVVNPADAEAWAEMAGRELTAVLGVPLVHHERVERWQFVMQTNLDQVEEDRLPQRFKDALEEYRNRDEEEGEDDGERDESAAAG